MSVFSMAGSNPALPTYPLQRSVRLRSSASAYFSRTPASATNQQKWTWSGWIKRGSLSVQTPLFYAGGTSTSDYTMINIVSADQLQVTQNNSSSTTFYYRTSAVFRDPSAWYHIVVAVDTTNATAADRAKLYVNGVQQIIGTGTNSPLNQNTFVNSITGHGIGNYATSNYYDGYLTEVNFIDGQALTPSSFGAYNSYGVWSPAKYTGTYGTNGFYLNFQDNSALTTTANIGIGKDSSGNGNYWTSNNISITAGVTYDSMLDVPTLSSNTNANFAVMNPLKIYTSNLGLTNGNLRLSDSNAVVTSAISTMSFGTSGKYYFECTMVAVATANSNYVGVIDATNGFGTAPFQNKGEYRSTGDIYNIAGTAQTVGASYTTNDVIGVAVDVTNGTVQFYKNNVAQGATPSFTFTAGTELWAAISTDNQVGTKTYALNFGQQPFTYTPPTGFNRLCTYNLPDSIVPVGAQYMAATTYTGNGSTQSIVNTVNGFSLQPDLVWYKRRNSADNHRLFDAVRGATKALFSDLTIAESTESGVTSFNTSGFTLGLAGNESSNTYVGWQWRASNASAVTNTSGSITSSVSVNQTAGFSIVTWTGTAASAATVGHGLGVAPKMIIIKQRNGSTYGWVTYHASVGAGSYLTLNGTSAATADTAMFNNTAPTSNVFTLSSGGDIVITNPSAGTMLAYCFSEISGYSKFGSYTGNGSTDGPFTYLGFRPRWLMIKRTDSAGYGWNIYDTARSTYNIAQQFLQANSSNAETNNSAYAFDLLSNGFKLRQTDALINASGGTYIYAAFAENPFKNALAR